MNSVPRQLPLWSVFCQKAHIQQLTAQEVLLCLTNVKSNTYNLQISVKLTKDVFLVPTLTTCGGFMTNFLFSPATISGFFSRMMLNTLLSNCKNKQIIIQATRDIPTAVHHSKILRQHSSMSIRPNSPMSIFLKASEHS